MGFQNVCMALTLFFFGLSLTPFARGESASAPPADLEYEFDDGGEEDWRLLYDSVGAFYNGLAKVELDGKYGFVNSAGELGIDLKFEDVDNFFCAGLAAFQTGDKWGYIDKEGNEVIKARFDTAGSFCLKGLARVRTADEGIFFNNQDKWGYINTKGEWVISPRFDFLASGFSLGEEELIPGRIGEKWLYVNDRGETVIELMFDNVEFAGRFYEPESPALIQIKGKWGYVNRQGKLIITPRFDEAEPFVNGKARVKRKGRKWRVIRAKPSS